MAIIKCKMCGGDLNLIVGQSVAECEFCGSRQTVPAADNEKKLMLFGRANRLRAACDFDKAAGIYEAIVADFPDEAEAYWGLVLCKYGIEYVDDPVTGKKIPTCHRSSFDSVLEDSDFEQALENADVKARRVYHEEAKTIEDIRKGIIAVSVNEEPYDIFICYKETDENGDRTLDSVLAQDIYDALTDKGYRTFFARITLEDKLGLEYEPYIFAALNSAQIMLAVGTDYEYFNAVWVKNEWSRFLKLIEMDKQKYLIPCFKGIDIYHLPKEFARLQAQDLGKVGATQDLLRGIEKLAPCRMNHRKEIAVQQTTAISSVVPLLKRAIMFLEDGEWDRADDFCEQVLNVDPENAEAYLGKLMAELQVRKQESLKNQAEPFDSRNNYQKVARFADEELKTVLSDYIEHINARNETARIDGIYNKAKNTMFSAKTESACKEAAQMFASISGWKDADEQIVVCQKKAEEIKVQMESDRLDCERQEEITRRETERKTKRNKKITVILTAIVCAVIAFVVILNTVIIPNSKYNDAIALMEVEKYTEAISAFEALNGYKDSTNKIDMCNTAIIDNKYNNAIALMKAGDVIEAYEILSALDGYKDSADIANSIYENNKVVKLKNAKVGDCVTFGTYEQDNNASNGQEDIEWLVLEVKDGKAFCISQYALDCKPYNANRTDGIWVSSSLRKWLNDDFINAAFSAVEKAMIPTVTVSADKNPEYSTDPGIATKDQVFLLSITEANQYFGLDSTRQCKPTDYAVTSGAHVSSTNSNCWWWLRSPGYFQHYAAGVHITGDVHEIGNSVSDDCAVRPALWIDLTEP